MTSDQTTGSANRGLAIHWRWYHFYFLLALFDVIVIVGSLVLYHRSIRSYRDALNELIELEKRNSWAASLRLAVLDLNAPGNDVFETRQVEAERARFDLMRTKLHLLVRRDAELGIDLDRFREQTDRMIEEEESIFAAFTQISDPRVPDDQRDQHLRAASASMAAMDRYQATSLQALFEIEQWLLSEERRLVDAHGATLERSAALEKYMLGTVFLILIGVFWYGRKLQQTHERMISEQQRLFAERHERLAAVGEVCSAVAHGIRNPLAAIVSSAQLALEYGTLDEATRLRIRDVLSEGQRLDRRVTRLLDFSRSPTGGFEPFSLKAVIQQAVHEISPRLQQAGVQVSFDCSTDGLQINGDRERFAQSIIEILSNSMDHMPTGGNVRIACARDSLLHDRARVSIHDDGPGIPEALRTRVFDLFFTSKAEGNGIGLASVKRTIELHGGQVCAAPPEHRGAHIQITLPLAG